MKNQINLHLPKKGISKTQQRTQLFKNFQKSDINSEVLNSSKPWDRLRVVCKQPHRNDVLFGLSLLKIRGQRLDNPQIFHQPYFENILPASGNQDKELPKNSKSDHRWKIRRNVCYRNLKLELEKKTAISKA